MFRVLNSMLSFLAVFLLVRLFYFVGAFLSFSIAAYLILFLASRSRPPGLYGDPMDLPLFLVLRPEFWLLSVGVGILAALIGPPLYHLHTMRGRGSLGGREEALEAPRAYGGAGARQSR